MSDDNSTATGPVVVDGPKGKKRVMADENMARVIYDMTTAKNHSKKWGEIAGTLREAVLEEIPEGESYEIVETSSGAILGSISEVSSKRFSVDLFRADHPEFDLDKYYVASVSRQVRTK